jgi:hypothetical protein
VTDIKPEKLKEEVSEDNKNDTWIPNLCVEQEENDNKEILFEPYPQYDNIEQEGKLQK